MRAENASRANARSSDRAAAYAPSVHATFAAGGRLARVLPSFEPRPEQEALADAVNACLTADNGIAPGKEADLDRALAAYHEAIAAVIGPARARLDMLLKAVPAVAERVRAASAAAPAPADGG